MKTLLILLTSLLSLQLSAQEAESSNRKNRTLSGSFTQISVSDGILLNLSAGGESVAVSFADEKYEEKFKTEVVNGVLKIYYDNTGVNYSDNNKRKLIAYVSFKTLEKLSASGGARVNIASEVALNNLEMKFSSGAKFEGKVKATSLDIDQSSGSSITISGSADKIKIESGSGAIFKGYDFTTKYCEAKASSAGSIRVNVNGELSASANSGGAIHYKGNAVIKDININSGGVVKKA